MKNAARIACGLALFFFALRPAYAAEEAKGLAPGWLSLDGSVGLLDKKIEEGKGSLEKALLGISISGFFDVGYTWSSNRASSISGRYFDQDHNKVIFNAFNLTLDKPEKDWGVGFHVVGDFGRTGELLREATLWGSRLHQEPSAELREAFLTFTIPLGEGLQVKGGKFVTPLGTETLLAPGAYNDNISRSFAFNLAVPFTHTGALLTYPFTKTFSASAGVVTGWDNPNDNNNSPSFLGGINFTPAEVFALASNIIVGPEQRSNTSHQRVTWSNVATIKPMDPLTVYLEYTLGHEQKAPTPSVPKDVWWHGLAGIASYNWTERFNTALRGEYFRDSDGARTGVSSLSLGEITLTAAYKFTAKLLGRVEVRQDWANKSVLAKSGAAADKSQTTLAVQAIYGF